MSSWAQRMSGLVTIWFRRGSSKTTRRPPARRAVGVEDLEGRQLMSAGVGGSLPIPPSLVSDVEVAGQLDRYQFQLNPGTVPGNRRMPVIIGFQVQPAKGSTVEPQIRRVGSTQGLGSLNLVRTDGPLFTQAAVPVTAPLTYQANVLGLNQTTGSYLLTAYLPGDANGDGVVDRTDTAVVRAAYGAASTSASNYNPNADMDNNGRVGELDWIVTNRNLGVRAQMIALSKVVSTN